MPSRDIFCNSIDFEIFRIDSIPSTNTYFKENYSLYKDKSVLIANSQTAGRGRFQRTWISDNDICFSILFKEKHPNAILSSLAIILALETLGIKAGIKWPNDIYLKQKKLSGILIEDVYEKEFVCSIVGIGINVEDKPKFNGIGLNKFISVSKNSIIETILYHYQNLLSKTMTELIILYKKYSIILDQKIWYKGSIYTACDITENGYLVIKNDKGIKTISSDEIDIKASLLNK